MGKKKKDHRNRHQTLMVMLDENEKAFIRQNAEAMGMTMSSYARFMLLLGMKKLGDGNDGN